ncbi:MAG: pyridoxamine kinase [Lachnospiraceae bacterium]|nr:pyridoxamine kinase [Lachnospiraceae bacterium]
MSYKRILTIQDISCFGQCSLTVALPILSAAGHETVILPSAVLSTHTAGFTGFTCRDLTEDIPSITAHWKKEGISFDAIYTGYLGSATQIDYVKDMIKDFGSENFVSIVDPAMADNGRLYPAFDQAFANQMKTLAFEADMILPNITEACFLTDTEYRESYDEAYIDGILDKLRASGAKTIILTGVGYTWDTTGVVVFEGDNKSYYKHKRISKGSHGTGDVYASSFTGAYLSGKTAYESAVIAADYTVRCIEGTISDESHWYGVKFEPALPYYMDSLKG